jgi:hypothetical protein
MSRQNDYCYTGWVPTPKVTLPTRAQLIAMRDYWLERGHNGTAAAIDNAIELIVMSTAQEQKTQDADWQAEFGSPAWFDSIEEIPF